MKFLTLAAFVTVLACACATGFFHRPSSHFGYNRPIVAPYAPYASPYYATPYVKNYVSPYVKNYASPYHYSGYNPYGYGGLGYYGYGDYGYYKK